MKPAICYLCHTDFRSEYFHIQAGGALVQFADYKPLPEGAGGHPRGLEWFCRHHLQAAQALTSSSTDEALSQLKTAYGEFPPYKALPCFDPELWVIAVGPNSGAVFTIVRQATHLPPIKVKELLHSGVFKVAQGWPQEFERWRSALVDAEAQVEVRFP